MKNDDSIVNVKMVELHDNDSMFGSKVTWRLKSNYDDDNNNEILDIQARTKKVCLEFTFELGMGVSSRSLIQALQSKKNKIEALFQTLNDSYCLVGPFKLMDRLSIGLESIGEIGAHDIVVAQRIAWELEVGAPS